MWAGRPPQHPVALPYEFLLDEWSRKMGRDRPSSVGPMPRPTCGEFDRKVKERILEDTGVCRRPSGWPAAAWAMILWLLAVAYGYLRSTEDRRDVSPPLCDLPRFLAQY